MLLRARIVCPITAPSLEDGAVFVSGARLAAVGRWSELRREHAGPAIDLGDVALLPGLINAHCHLDYTHLAGHLPPPRSFSEWIQGVLGLKAGWSFSEYAASWIDGARQLAASGCTTVVDIEAVPELLPEAWNSTPLRLISALEMTGVRSTRSDAEILDETLARAARLRHPRNRAALSPHAPYSTRAELLALAAGASRERGLLRTTHVAESVEEFEMFRHASGAMHHWLQGQRDCRDCGRHSPVRHVASTGYLGPEALLAHVNYLDDGDETLLADSGTHVVHCPRSHSYFDHVRFPYRRLREAGVNVCLGTDSLLSVRKLGQAKVELDLFAELAAFARSEPDVSPTEILELVTVNAARAIGRRGELGELTPGGWADAVAVPLPAGTPRGAVAEGVLAHRGRVAALMIGGRWVAEPAGEHSEEATAA